MNNAIFKETRQMQINNNIVLPFVLRLVDSNIKISFTARLDGGSSSHEGRLQVTYYGLWGTVCDDGFTDAAASVVCRNLGFPYV